MLHYSYSSLAQSAGRGTSNGLCGETVPAQIHSVCMSELAVLGNRMKIIYHIPSNTAKFISREFIFTQVCMCFRLRSRFEQLSSTRKPCNRNETARRHSCSFRFKVRRQHSLYKFKSSQASKARLQSSKHTGVKQNLTQNGHSGSFKVTCFEVSGKAIRD